MAFAWKFLLPLAFINLMSTAVEVYFFGFYNAAAHDLGVITGDELWVMAAINSCIAVVAIALFGRATRNRMRPNPVKLHKLEPAVTVVGVN
jgi:NADH:ubiquinone oxidoreductase subunit H